MSGYLFPLRRQISRSCSRFHSLLPYNNIIIRSLSVKVGDKRYTQSHEYVQLTGSTTGKVGISDFAQSALGDIVHVDLPDPSSSYRIGDTFGSVESVKSANNIYAPIDLTVKSVNSKISEDPAIVNSGAEKDGWMIEVDIKDVKQLENLMDEQKYKKHCENEKH